MARSDLDSWLASYEESILEPELPICDPHHHLWDRDGSRYMLEELWSDTGSGHAVRETVFVECMSGYHEHGPKSMRPVGETRFVEEVAQAAATGDGAQIAAIVGYVDLTLGPAAGSVLDAHIEHSERFRGIRHAAGWDPSPDIRNSHTRPPQGLLLRDDFRAGFAVLSRRGLSFDAWLYHSQIGDLTDLARAFPDTPIVLDHVGGPLGIGPYENQRERVLAGWQDNIAELALCPNVAVKLGGLGMPINGFGFHKRESPVSSTELADAWAPYYLYCIEHFGVERSMFESNFPVDKVSCSYAVLWNAFKRVTSDFSPDDKKKLFRDSARRFYRC